MPCWPRGDAAPRSPANCGFGQRQRPSPQANYRRAGDAFRSCITANASACMKVRAVAVTLSSESLTVHCSCAFVLYFRSFPAPPRGQYPRWPTKRLLATPYPYFCIPPVSKWRASGCCYAVLLLKSRSTRHNFLHLNHACLAQRRRNFPGLSKAHQLDKTAPGGSVRKWGWFRFRLPRENLKSKQNRKGPSWNALTWVSAGFLLPVWGKENPW